MPFYFVKHIVLIIFAVGLQQKRHELRHQNHNCNISGTRMDSIVDCKAKKTRSRRYIIMDSYGTCISGSVVGVACVNIRAMRPTIGTYVAIHFLKDGEVNIVPNQPT